MSRRYTSEPSKCAASRFRSTQRAARFRHCLSPAGVALEDRTLLSGIPNATIPIGLVGPLGGSSSPYGLSPSEIRNQYDFNTIAFQGAVQGNGAGQTIAIVDAYVQPDIVSDLHAFDQYYGLPDPPHFAVSEEPGAQTRHLAVGVKKSPWM